MHTWGYDYLLVRLHLKITSSPHLTAVSFILHTALNAASNSDRPDHRSSSVLWIVTFRPLRSASFTPLFNLTLAICRMIELKPCSHFSALQLFVSNGSQTFFCSTFVFSPFHGISPCIISKVRLGSHEDIWPWSRQIPFVRCYLIAILVIYIFYNLYYIITSLLVSFCLHGSCLLYIYKLRLWPSSLCSSTHSSNVVNFTINAL